MMQLLLNEAHTLERREKRRLRSELLEDSVVIELRSNLLLAISRPRYCPVLQM